MINIASQDANREHYSFGEAKTKVLTKSTSLKPEEWTECQAWKLNNIPLEVAKEQVHLGLIRSTDHKHDAAVADRIKCARRALYSITGAGMHGLNGLNPVASIKIWNAYISTRLSYGLEVLYLTNKNLESLEKFKRTIMRQLQHLPQSTSKAAIYLLTGTFPFEATWDRKLLTLFGILARSEGTIEKQILQRQLTMKAANSNSWAFLIRKTLWKYNLPSPFQLMSDPPPKESWKRTIKQAARHYWGEHLKTEAQKQSSMAYLNIEACQAGKPHHVWSTVSTNPRDTMRATVKAKMLVGQYILQSQRHRRRQASSPTCLLCGLEIEDMPHFLIDCRRLQETRLTYMHVIERLVIKAACKNEWSNIVHERKLLTQLIIDCTHPSLPAAIRMIVSTLEPITRHLCFALHNRRQVLLADTENGIIKLSTPTHPLPPLPCRATQRLKPVLERDCEVTEGEDHAISAVRL